MQSRFTQLASRISGQASGTMPGDKGIGDQLYAGP